MKLAALAAAALLAPTVAAAPPRAPDVVDVRVAHDRAHGFVAGRRARRDGRARARWRRRHPSSWTAATPPSSGSTAGATSHCCAFPASRARRRGSGGGDGASLLGRPATVVRHVHASVDGGPRRPALVLRARVTVGDSGAPVLTDSGRVAGVLFARSRTRASTAYAVDAAAVAELLHSSP